jgi:hypothetical protein
MQLRQDKDTVIQKRALFGDYRRMCAIENASKGNPSEKDLKELPLLEGLKPVGQQPVTLPFLKAALR